jgi:hypothetical protein
MRPTPLPQHLTSTPFAVGSSGLSAKRLRASDLDRSVWGVRALGIRTELRDRCALVATRLGADAIFSHATAALLLGAPLPPAVERLATLHVTVSAPRSAPHARGIRGHSLSIADSDVQVTRGILHTTPGRTWCDLAGTLALDDLIAAGDYFIHWRSPMVAREELVARVSGLAARRGVRDARAAVQLLNDRPESRQESLLRLIVLRAGLPEPSINHTLVDTETGTRARPDFRFEEHKLILEYQGDYHRSRTQWRKDMTRRSRLEAMGWYVMELNADDLRDPDELCARIRLVLSRRSA